MNRKLETENYFMQNFEKKVELKPNAMCDDYEEKSCWLCAIKIELDEKNLVFTDHCHLTSKFRGFSHDESNL